ncbi:MAG: replication protein [Heyndrickxia coagulans]|jgi:phage replication O-like protein O
MANPQKEHGYTGIANEILEKIAKTNLNGTQFRILMVIWRFTYGFQRKQHELSYSFLSEAIGIKDRRTIYRELKILIDKKIVSVVEKGARGVNVLAFNKNYEEWSNCWLNSQQSPLLATSPTELTANPPTELLANPPHKKENIKENIKENTPKRKTYSEDSTYYKMAIYFFGKVEAVAKEAGVEHLIKKSNLQKWADDFRKLIELDGVDKRLAKDVMDWVTQDPFWRTNVLSATKLRQKFGELAIKMQAQKQPPQQKIRRQADPRDKEIAFQRWIQAGGDPNEFNWSS